MKILRKIMFLLFLINGFIAATAQGIAEDKKVYENQYAGIQKLYVTVPQEQEAQAGKKSFTFKDVIADVDWQNDSEPEAFVIIENEKDSSQKINGVIKQRGHSTREAEQKSFKISLKNGLWNGQKVINLNKHPFDSTRIRNHLSFEIFKEMENITSLRTGFVQLFIKNQQDGGEEYTDYGLYTYVENVDKNYLEARGLDSKGNLYKAENFEFLRYEDEIKNKNEKGYEKSKFEKRLEIKGSDDHSKLIKMLNDINKQGFKSIDLWKYFDEENFVTWLAVNILKENIDTEAQNFYLYSPADSGKWYFIPWDYDGAWGFYDTPGAEYKLPLWKQNPVDNFWNNTVCRLFLLSDANRKKLDEKMKALLTGALSERAVAAKVQKYKIEIGGVLKSQPDIGQNDFINKNGVEKLDDEYIRLGKTPEKNYKKYIESIKMPTPFFIWEAEWAGKNIKIAWGKSISLKKKNIKYNVKISSSPDMKKILFSRNGIKDEFVTVQGLKSGKIYISVTAADADGNIMEPFDEYYDTKENRSYFGIKELEI